MELTREEEGTRVRTKREQILDGAQRVFLREGFAAASTETLAHEVGVSKRTLYAYYASKEDLFVDVVRRLTLENPGTQVLDFMQGLAPHSVEELREALLTLSHKVVATMMRSENLALLRAIIADAHRFPQLTETLRLTIPERAIGEVARMLERARGHGIAIQPGDTVVMTRLFIGPLLTYAVFDGLLHPQSEPRLPDTEQVAATVDLFLHAILTNRPPERSDRE